MTEGEGQSLRGLALWLGVFMLIAPGTSEVLTPPYFNLAEGRRITASATCGEGVEEPELYCNMIGANSDSLNFSDNILIQGQVN